MMGWGGFLHMSINVESVFFYHFGITETLHQDKLNEIQWRKSYENNLNFKLNVIALTFPYSEETN